LIQGKTDGGGFVQQIFPGEVERALKKGGEESKNEEKVRVVNLSRGEL